MTDKTANLRQERRTALMRKQGFVRYPVWAHPDDRFLIARLAAELMRERFTKDENKS